MKFKLDHIRALMSTTFTKISPWSLALFCHTQTDFFFSIIASEDFLFLFTDAKIKGEKKNVCSITLI